MSLRGVKYCYLNLWLSVNKSQENGGTLLRLCTYRYWNNYPGPGKIGRKAGRTNLFKTLLGKYTSTSLALCLKLFIKASRRRRPTKHDCLNGPFPRIERCLIRYSYRMTSITDLKWADSALIFFLPVINAISAIYDVKNPVPDRQYMRIPAPSMWLITMPIARDS